MKNDSDSFYDPLVLQKAQKYTGPKGTSHGPCRQMFVHTFFPTFSLFNIMNMVDYILFSKF